MKITELTTMQWLTVTLRNGNELRLVRRPFSDQVLRESNSIQPEEGETAPHLRARRLAVWIETWDVLDEDGNPVPPSPELLAQLDYADLVAIDVAIGEDFKLPTTGATKEDGTTPSEPSGDGSSVKEA